MLVGVILNQEGATKNFSRHISSDGGGSSTYNMKYVTVTCSFVPDVIIVFANSTNGTYDARFTGIVVNNNNPYYDFNCITLMDSKVPLSTNCLKVELGTTTDVPYATTSYSGSWNFKWYAFKY